MLELLYDCIQLPQLALHHLYVLVVLLLAVDQHAAVPVELNGGSQAGDLLLILGDNVCEDGVFSGRDLLRQLDILGQGQLALLDRALEVNILDRVTQVGRLPDDGDQAVLDRQVHLCAVLDVRGDVAAGGDGEGLAAAVRGQSWLCARA